MRYREWGSNGVLQNGIQVGINGALRAHPPHRRAQELESHLLGPGEEPAQSGGRTLIADVDLLHVDDVPDHSSAAIEPADSRYQDSHLSTSGAPILSFSRATRAHHPLWESSQYAMAPLSATSSPPSARTTLAREAGQLASHRVSISLTGPRSRPPASDIPPPMTTISGEKQ